MKIAIIASKGLPSMGGAERVVEAIVQCMTGKHALTITADVTRLLLVRIFQECGWYGCLAYPVSIRA